MTEPTGAEVDATLAREVYMRGANRPFGELTVQDALARADELRAVTGWGPTVRVAPVAQAWRELSMTMQREGASSVRELPGAVVLELAQKLWVTLPSGPIMS